MKDSDFKRKLFWECIDNLGSKGRSSAAKLAEPALHIPQHTHAGSDASTQICPTCDGDGIARDGGYPYNGKCGRCSGSGKLQHA